MPALSLILCSHKEMGMMTKRYLLLLLVFGLAACTPDLEPIVVTPVEETAVPTLTPTILSTSENALQLTEPATAAPTFTPTATPSPMATLAEIEDWPVYENNFYNYRFSYPSTATISVQGVTGFPTEELQVGMTAVAYRQHLENILPSDICVSVSYETGFVNFLPPWESGGKYTGPCGVTGIGAYDVTTITETVTIDEQVYFARGTVVRERNEAATWRDEFYFVTLNDGTQIQYGTIFGTQEQHLANIDTLRQIVESFHSATSAIMIPTAVFPPISLTETMPFTQTTHGYTLQYPVGFYPAQNLGIESDINFATQPNAEDLIAMSQQDFWITIRVEDNSDGLSLDQWADRQLLPRGTQPLSVAGVPALQGSGDLAASGNGHGGFGIATYFAQDGRIFTIMGLALTPNALIHHISAYQLLLDTFSFLP
jgi:hypothetical protein